MVIPAVTLTLAPGEVYAGYLLGKDGEPGHHMILLPGEVSMPWEKAMEWAASIGGDLPTRREQSLLYANVSENFKRDWYWSNTQYAGYSGYAWRQDFYDGGQDFYREGNEFRARAVRRIPAQ
ncbi:DUF1566 domain-containing protein [Cupriavidus oxalaticus]|uniref:DUF1566 domain-containing protein n=1 Tax=Cupriavidus oxalaticus TaxID=96344 RepID=A0A5P3VR93_9BURK|nr:DUF1566 domain-containing protein [Cupriavidus oxalaticus]